MTYSVLLQTLPRISLGLLSAIDHAVLLPSEQLQQKEALEHEYRQRHAAAFQLWKENSRWRSSTADSIV